MTTSLDKTLKRELTIKGQPYIVAISPEGLKLTRKGRRKGLVLEWEALVSGEAALSVALNASVGQFASDDAPAGERARRKAKASDPKNGP